MSIKLFHGPWKEFTICRECGHVTGEFLSTMCSKCGAYTGFGSRSTGRWSFYIDKPEKQWHSLGAVARIHREFEPRKSGR